MATKPVLLSPERIKEIVCRKRRHDLGWATGDEKMTVNNAVVLVRDDLPDLFDHITSQDLNLAALTARAEAAERTLEEMRVAASDEGTFYGLFVAAVGERDVARAELAALRGRRCDGCQHDGTSRYHTFPRCERLGISNLARDFYCAAHEPKEVKGA